MASLKQVVIDCNKMELIEISELAYARPSVKSIPLITAQYRYRCMKTLNRFWSSQGFNDRVLENIESDETLIFDLNGAFKSVSIILDMQIIILIVIAAAIENHGFYHGNYI